MDRNGDGRVSREEFLTYTRKDDFEKNEEWKPAVDEPEDIFTEKEFDQFNQHYDDYQYYDYDEEIDRDGNVVKTKTQSQERRHETGRQHEQQPHEGQQQEHKDGETNKYMYMYMYTVGSVYIHVESDSFVDMYMYIHVYMYVHVIELCLVHQLIIVTGSEKTDHSAQIQYGPQALQRSRSRDFAISMPRCCTAS